MANVIVQNGQVILVDNDGNTIGTFSSIQAAVNAAGSAPDDIYVGNGSYSSAALKAMAMAAVLFALTQFHILGKNTSVSQGFVLAVFAMVVYTPLAYFTDRAVYNRVQRRQQQQKS